MHFPTSTYRMQFRNGMTFDRARQFVPYLRDLGISHLYASPVFTATTGSTHGYDITNCNEIDPEVGGRKGFDRLTDALGSAGMGLILDIVPNHMAASLENAWWADVLRHGKLSAHARCFDIDWSERITLPILGKPFEQALAAGEVALRRKPETGKWCLAYDNALLPLESQNIGVAPETNDKRLIARIHDQQNYRLTDWRDAARHLSYRRFFEITGLVGLRVEDEGVFDDSHRLILELVRNGQVQGLRIDHIDGLTDPETYLERLRSEVGPDVYIVAEKILAHGEQLPTTWPIEGTTGYEFIAALSNIYTDKGGLAKLTTIYAGLAPDTANLAQGLRNAKSLMVDCNFEGETARLVGIATKRLPAVDPAGIASAIRELLISFPVYRTYARRGRMAVPDAAILASAARQAARHARDTAALEATTRLLRDGLESEFRRRFQQLSGPVMAKAVEDTLFYRANRLLALNEVGGDMDMVPGGVGQFHELMQARHRLQPHGLSATSTHDTKRGEDARARLFVLSECAQAWENSVARWRKMNHKYRTELPDGPAPDANVEWMLYQALAGIWPEATLADAPENLTERFVAYAEKSVREAKLSTSWNEGNQTYEQAVMAYAKALTDPVNNEFRQDFSRVMKPIIMAVHLNSLSQTLIKLMAPGIPDIYQGAEALDFSMVDPDNRNTALMADLARNMADNRSIPALAMPGLKQRLVRTGLKLRQRLPELFRDGDYTPLKVTGPARHHIVPLARNSHRQVVIVITPRLMIHAIQPPSIVPDRAFWAGTIVEVPDHFSGEARDLLSSKVLRISGHLELSDVLEHLPLALLVSRGLD